MLAVLPASAQQAAGAPEAQVTVAADQMPNGYVLESASPNPFTSNTTVGFAVAEAQRVEVALYDALGRKVRTLVNGTVEAGRRYEAAVNAAGLPSGLYLIRLQGDTFSTTRRVTLVR